MIFKITIVNPLEYFIRSPEPKVQSAGDGHDEELLNPRVSNWTAASASRTTAPTAAAANQTPPGAWSVQDLAMGRREKQKPIWSRLRRTANQGATAVEVAR